jgi:hypothetical protein
VLSLPSFTWTPLPATDFYAQVDAACARVGEKYMFTFTNNPKVNGKVIAGEERVCTGKLDYQLLDLSMGIWTRDYKAGQRYTVPEVVYNKIGGNGEGGATLVEPKAGFVSKSLADAFNIKRGDNKDVESGGSNSPHTGGEKSKEIAGGAIAGIVIGVVAAIALVGVIIFLVRKKRNARARRVDAEGPHEVYGYVPGEANKNTIRAEMGPQEQRVYEVDGTTTAASEFLTELDGYQRPRPESMAKTGLH